jgi:glutathione gamma-glutamylcysteinyltransferase
MDPIGHVSVVGAYDAASERVLVFDVDASSPRPYWVSLSRFVQGMNTPDDETGIARGYLVVRFP